MVAPRLSRWRGGYNSRPCGRRACRLWAEERVSLGNYPHGGRETGAGAAYTLTGPKSRGLLDDEAETDSGIEDAWELDCY